MEQNQPQNTQMHANSTEVLSVKPPIGTEKSSSWSGVAGDMSEAVKQSIAKSHHFHSLFVPIEFHSQVH